MYRKPHRFKRKRPIWRSRFFWRGIFILIFIISLFYFLFFSEIFQVKKINISGLEKISETEVRLTAEQKVENNILFFRTKSIFLLNLDKIKKEIKNNFPQVQELKIQRKLFNSLNFLIIERKGQSIWCKIKEEQEQCFLLDKEGIIFQESQAENSLIKIIDKGGTLPLVLGKKVIEKYYLDSIFKIQEKLKNIMQIEIKEFILPSDRLTIKTLEGWEVYFNLKGDIDWQMTKLSAVLKEKIPPEKRKNLEYIELRFGNLAPFKYRD